MFRVLTSMYVPLFPNVTEQQGFLSRTFKNGLDTSKYLHIALEIQKKKRKTKKMKDDKHSKKERVQYPAILTEKSLVNKGFILRDKNTET